MAVIIRERPEGRKDDTFTGDEYDALRQSMKSKKLFFIQNKDFKTNSKVISDILTGQYEGLTDCFNYYNKILFKNCHFTDLNIKNKDFSIPFTFEGCSFNGNTIFKECSFNCDFSFNKSKFSGNLTLDTCDFNAYADFNNIITNALSKVLISGNGNKEYHSTIAFKKSELLGMTSFYHLNGLDFNCQDTKFSGCFRFGDVKFGLRSLFYNVDWWYNQEHKMEKELIDGLQEFIYCLEHSNLYVMSEMMKEVQKNVMKYKSLLPPETEEMEKRRKMMGLPPSNNQISPNLIPDVVLEEEMCEIVGIGPASFRKRKTLAKHKAEKGEFLWMPTPSNKGHKPLKYPLSEVMEFKRRFEEECKNS